MGVAQVAEHRTVDAAVVGSSPITHPIYHVSSADYTTLKSHDFGGTRGF